ncbi:UDP-N-acetylmuramoyl-L-alanyl-D-glutamate--2,6-diaminopimelate ligase [Patescibacteria group bacterium]|nr:UDP-N-acetylmuramoyl-L-alanyl-D-glutamate--2,6-diaminopimelate ligase [Patescibacteria group bacterium]
MRFLDYLRKKISPDNPFRLLWHKSKAVVAAYQFGFPGKKMICIGVTGTNGKTTTVHMAEHILRTAGKKVGMLSTAEFRINGKITPNRSKKTTLSPFLTQKFLKQCLRHKVDYVVIEASSHALHQHRLWGIPFSISAITNITHEHLDYHQTMEKYKEAKKDLFKNVSRTCHRHLPDHLKAIPHQQAMILNTGDTFFQDFNQISCPTKITYGLGEGNLKAHHITYSKFDSKFALHHGSDEVGIELKIPGSFNIENALAASGIALACKVSLEDVKQALESFEGVPGRMESIGSPKGFEVIVDFALTPDALEKLYSTLRQTAPARIIGIIGSCGDRDKEKRPVMGEIVANHSDLTIVTDEEPYSENPMDIMQAVLEGAKKIKKLEEDLHLIEDRYTAIKFAIQNAEEGDIVVVTGMGSFDTRTMNEGPIEWDERKVVREIINKHSG